MLYYIRFTFDFPSLYCCAYWHILFLKLGLHYTFHKSNAVLARLYTKTIVQIQYVTISNYPRTASNGWRENIKMVYGKLFSGWVIWTFKFTVNESLGVSTKANCSPVALEAIYVNSERTVKTRLIWVCLKTMTYRSQNREAPHKILTFINQWQNLTESKWIISVRLLPTGGEITFSLQRIFNVCIPVYTPIPMYRHTHTSIYTTALLTAILILT